MAKERADKLKNRINYVKEVLADPLRTDREIAKAMGVSHVTVQQSRKETYQILPDSELIEKLLESDLEIQERIAEIKKARLSEPDKVNNGDLDKWEQTATKRRQLLTGNPTDRLDVT